MIEKRKYKRVTIVVDAVEVTAENLEEVAAWCGGRIITEGSKTHIDVPVNRPISRRQRQAFPGDFVTFNEEGNNFKVYTEKAFKKNFEDVFQLPPPDQMAMDLEMAVSDPIAEAREQEQQKYGACADNMVGSPIPTYLEN